MSRKVFWEPPTPLQDWDDEQGHRQAQWFELFYDLIFVAVALQFGNYIKSEQTWEGYGVYFLLFAAFWQVWTSFTHYVTRFYCDDIVHTHLYFLIQTIGVATMAVNIDTDSTRHDGLSLHRGFCIGFLITRAGLILQYIFVVVWIHRVRLATLIQLAGLIISVILAIVATVIASDLAAGILLAFAIVIEIAFHLKASFLPKHQRLPVHVEHLAERHGLFIMLILGESIISLLATQLSGTRELDHYLIDYLGILLVVALYLSYFDAQPFHAELHALRMSHGRLYVYLHLILSASLLLVGISLKLLLVHADDPLSVKDAWSLCAPLAVSIGTLLWLRQLHHMKVSENRFLLVFRIACAIAVALLPLAYTSLTPVSILGYCLLIQGTLVVIDLVVVLQFNYAIKEEEDLFGTGIELSMDDAAECRECLDGNGAWTTVDTVSTVKGVRTARNSGPLITAGGQIIVPSGHAGQHGRNYNMSLHLDGPAHANHHPPHQHVTTAYSAMKNHADDDYNTREVDDGARTEFTSLSHSTAAIPPAHHLLKQQPHHHHHHHHQHQRRPESPELQQRGVHEMELEESAHAALKQASDAIKMLLNEKRQHTPTLSPSPERRATVQVTAPSTVTEFERHHKAHARDRSLTIGSPVSSTRHASAAAAAVRSARSSRPSSVTSTSSRGSLASTSVATAPMSLTSGHSVHRRRKMADASHDGNLRIHAARKWMERAGVESAKHPRRKRTKADAFFTNSRDMAQSPVPSQQHQDDQDNVSRHINLFSSGASVSRPVSNMTTLSTRPPDYGGTSSSNKTAQRSDIGMLAEESESDASAARAMRQRDSMWVGAGNVDVDDDDDGNVDNADTDDDGHDNDDDDAGSGSGLGSDADEAKVDADDDVGCDKASQVTNVTEMTERVSHVRTRDFETPTEVQLMDDEDGHEDEAADARAEKRRRAMEEPPVVVPDSATGWSRVRRMLAPSSIMSQPDHQDQHHRIHRPMYPHEGGHVPGSVTGAPDRWGDLIELMNLRQQLESIEENHTYGESTALASHPSVDLRRPTIRPRANPLAFM